MNRFNQFNACNALAANTVGAADILSLTPAAWYRYGVGITVTGQGVSTWADQSGNALDLLQTSDGARPALQADNSILFNGTDEFLTAGAFTHNQPVTWYLLMKQITWTDNDIFCSAPGASGILQRLSSPSVRLNFGATLDNGTLGIDAYGVVCGVANGASSVLQVNTTTVTGNGGANNPGGFVLGSNSSGLAGFSNIQVKEVILFAAAHDAATRASVIAYLAAVGGISI